MILGETGRMAIAILLCTIASASSQSPGWFFSATGMSNWAQESTDGQIHLKNPGSEAALHLNGSRTSVGASQLSTNNLGPSVVFHKGRGVSDAEEPVQVGDTIGSINFKASVLKADGVGTEQANIARLYVKAIGPGLQSLLCLRMVDNTDVYRDVLCFGPSGVQEMKPRRSR